MSKSKSKSKKNDEDNIYTNFESIVRTKLEKKIGLLGMSHRSINNRLIEFHQIICCSSPKRSDYLCFQSTANLNSEIKIRFNNLRVKISKEIYNWRTDSSCGNSNVISNKKIYLLKYNKF